MDQKWIFDGGSKLLQIFLLYLYGETIYLQRCGCDHTVTHTSVTQ